MKAWFHGRSSQFFLRRVAPVILFVCMASQRILFPGMTENETVLVHPVGLAGYFGLQFNLWRLFPVGRFDAGRIVYGLLGYRRALVVSWIAIAVLIACGTFWSGWPSVALFGALTLIRLRGQHPAERHAEPIDLTTKTRPTYLAVNEHRGRLRAVRRTKESV